MRHAPQTRLEVITAPPQGERWPHLAGGRETDAFPLKSKEHIGARAVRGVVENARMSENPFTSTFPFNMREKSENSS